MEWIQPYLGQLTFGGLAGLATGFAIKAVGRMVAIALGLLFIAVQILVYLGYLQVDWLRLQRDVEPLLQQDKVEGMWNSLLSLLTQNLPFGGAYIAGLLLGLRRG